MPNNGQLLEAWKNPSQYGWQAMALRCQSSASVDASGTGTITYGHGATAVTNWAPNAIDLPEGMRLEVSSSWDGTNGIWSVSYYGPGAPFGGFHRSGSTYRDTVSIEVRPIAVLMYSKLTGSLFRILWTGLEVFVNDAYDSLLSGFDDISFGVGPNYVPILGIPVYITGGGSGTHSAAPVIEICNDTEGEGERPGTDGGLEGDGEEEISSSGWTYNPCDPGGGLPITYQVRMRTTISGGWRWLVDGSWEDLPVYVDVRDAPSLGGCANLDLDGIITTSRTWGNHLATDSWRYYNLEYLGREYPIRSYVDIICEPASGGDPTHNITYGPGEVECNPDECGETRIYRDVYKTTNKLESRGGAIRLQPNLDHILERLGDDYAAEIFRGHFPEIRGTANRNCTSREGSGECITQSASQDYVTHPDLSQFVGVVGQGDHPTLDCLDYPFSAPCAASAGKLESVTYQYLSPARACICPWTWFGPIPPEPCGSGYSGTIGIACGLEWDPIQEGTWVTESVGWNFPSYVGMFAGEYQWHLVDEARYLATWCNPFWLLGYWTQPNEPDYWAVDGSPLSWPEYWGPIREQWFGDAFLPGDERTRQRNHLIFSPAETEQGHTPFLDFAFAGLRWIGASRYKVLSNSIPGSVQLSLTRPGVWSPRSQEGTPDCAIELTALGIRVTDFVEGECWVELDLAQWTTDPWLLLQLARQVELDWELTNVTAMSVQLVGFDGAATTITDEPGTFDMFPVGRSQTKYAGSWAIDNGALAVSDFGVDEDPLKGISADVMSQPETVMAFQLAKGQNYAKLRFKITPEDPEEAVLIEWPRFDLVNWEPFQIWESGKTCALLWEDGPGVRWGQNTWYIPMLGFQDPPVPTGLGVTSTMIDALATIRRLFTGTGTDSLISDITSDLSNWVDDYEGPPSIAVVDKFGMGVLLPDTETNTRFAMINSFSEVPPMSCWPTRKRSAPTWVPTGSDDYWAGVQDWTQRHRYLVGSDALAKLKNDELEVGVEVILPNPWKAWKFAPALDNTETWQISVNDTVIAQVRPWHGYYYLHKLAGESLGGLHLCRQKIGQFLFAVYAQADLISVLRFDSTLSQVDLLEVISGEGFGRAQIAYHPRASLGVVYEQDGEVKFTESYSVAHNSGWSTPVAVVEGKNPAYAIDEKFGLEYLAVYQTDRWKLYYREPNGEFDYISDIALTASEDSSAGLEVAPDGSNFLIFVYEDSGTVRKKYSTNQGKTWNDL